MNETNEPGPFWIVLIFISFHSNSNHICLFHLRHITILLSIFAYFRPYILLLSLLSTAFRMSIVHLSIDIFQIFFSFIIFTERKVKKKKMNRKTCPLRKSKKRSFMNILISKCDSTIEYFDMMTKEFSRKRIKDTRSKTTIWELRKTKSNRINFSYHSQ